MAEANRVIMGAAWSETELNFIRSNYDALSCRKIAAQLPGRTISAVQHAVYNLGLKYKPAKLGDGFGRLTIIGNTYTIQRKTYRISMVRCKCNCGRIVVKALDLLIAGKSRSCGCLHSEKVRERAIKRNTTHGLSKHPLHRVWIGMLNRCNYPESHKDYHVYAGKGIKVCGEWVNDFKAFYDWAMANGWRKRLTIDRKNNNEGYCPLNCKISTHFEQAKNRSDNIHVTAFGETKIIADWSRDPRCAVSYNVLRIRLRVQGWPAEKAITTSTRPYKRVTPS